MKLLAAIVVALALSACDRNELTGPTAALGSDFTLAPGGIVTVDSLGVRFLRVSHDSRCPINAICITAGTATIEVALSTLNGGRTYDLSLIPTREVTHEGRTVTFIKLEPSLVAGESIPLANYRATLRVTR